MSSRQLARHATCVLPVTVPFDDGCAITAAFATATHLFVSIALFESGLAIASFTSSSPLFDGYVTYEVSMHIHFTDSIPYEVSLTVEESGPVSDPDQICLLSYENWISNNTTKKCSFRYRVSRSTGEVISSECVMEHPVEFCKRFSHDGEAAKHIAILGGIRLLRIEDLGLNCVKSERFVLQQRNRIFEPVKLFTNSASWTLLLVTPRGGRTAISLDLKRNRNYMLGKTVSAASTRSGRVVARLDNTVYKLTVGLLLCWCITALGLIRGVKVLGYISMFTATVPYAIIAILFVRGITLEGAYSGIQYYLFQVDFSRLLELGVWSAALGQSCFSLSVGTGGLLALSSYNKRTHNPFRDALIICFTDSFMSIFGGVAIFSILGFMAQNQNATVPDVVQSGVNLAFVAYPEAMSQMPLPWLWSFLFFFMLFLLGISTMFGFIESTVTCFVDSSEWCARHKEITVCTICTFGAACGSIFLWGNGIHFFQVVNTYVGHFALSLIVLSELVLIDFIYGPCRFWRDVRAMMGAPRHLLGRLLGPSGWYLKLAMFTTAPALSAMVVYHSFEIPPLTYGKETRTYSYPQWSEYFGWFVGGLAFVPVPVVMVVNLVRYLRSGESVSDLFRPHPEHPAIVYGLAQENERKHVDESSAPTVTDRM